MKKRGVVSSPVDAGHAPHILIILLGALGDIARGIRVLRSVKNRYPNAHITWLVEKKWSSFLSLHPDIDSILHFEKKNWLRSILEFRRYAREKKNAGSGFDITLDMSRHAKSGVLSYLSNSPLRIGFHPRNAKEGNHFFQNVYIPEVNMKESKVYHYAAFARAIGAECGADELKAPALSVSDLAAVVRDDYPIIAQKKCASVVLGSSWISKDWHTEGYLRLIQKLLADTDFEILLQGDPGKAEFAARLKAEAGATGVGPNSERIHVLAGTTTLPQLTALLSHSEFAVGPDSGPGHMCSAVGTPYVSLFGPTAPDRVAPFGYEELVVRQNLDCMPCYKRECPGRQHVCMQLLSVDDIVQKVYRISRGGVSVDYQ